jgi:hypothetical protein
MREQITVKEIKPTQDYSTLTISLNMDYYRDEFRKVFEKWQQDIQLGLRLTKQNELFDDLIRVLEDDNEVK